MPIMTCHTDWTDFSKTWTEYSFHGEERARFDVAQDDPADLHIAYEAAKAEADQQARTADERFVPGEAKYDVYVRVVRRHRLGGEPA